jgi:peptide/nickel transport system substrate-binding protein
VGRPRRTTTAWAAVLAAAALALSACDGGPAGGGVAQQAPGVQALNAQDRATLQEGGDLRLPLDALPDNFNYNQLDGSLADGRQVLWALMPRTFNDGADGTPELDTDYMESAELTSGQPQVVTYRVRPDAVWNSGRPITWEDFQAQWQALDGSDPAFAVSSTTGYDAVASVERGTDDKEVVVTFERPFAEWQGLFSPLYPLETNRDAATFNEGWRTEVLDGAGPFRVETIDQVAQTIVLVRNESWWGETPRLDRLIFSVVERSALADALANNEIDWYKIGSSVDLYQRAVNLPGVEIRSAPEPTYNHVTFNGAPGSIMEDPALRRAIAKGIDREAIGRALIGQITPQVSLVQNHIFAVGSAGYQDNTGGLGYDPEAARAELDGLGWAPQGEFRARDGRELALRYVSTAANPISDTISRAVQQQLAQIGVRVIIEPVPAADFFDQFVRPGNFDLTGFGWQSTSTPFSSSRSLYAEPVGDDAQQNYGRVFSPEVLALYDQGIAELDEQVRMDLANQADALIWQQVHHLPLYALPGAHAVRATLANFGAKGLGDWNYVDAGFVQG